LNQTLKFVKTPQDWKIIRFNLEVEDAMFKACLVAKDFTQREGVDFNEALSLVVKYMSIQILLVMAALFDLELVQEVKTNFLHGELEERIYMH
jgi:hypothetical protein